jgi:hypothetical protein
MASLDDTFLRANSEANEIFERMRAVVEERIEQGQQELSILEVARESGLEVDERHLSELQLPDSVPVNRILPWYDWFPVRPFWCWWWHSSYPWYRCCPYWWYRCHWYPW